MLALLPLALSEVVDEPYLRRLGHHGHRRLVTSTLLTLVVVPVIYELTGKRSKVRRDLELND